MSEEDQLKYMINEILDIMREKRQTYKDQTPKHWYNQFRGTKDRDNIQRKLIEELQYEVSDLKGSLKHKQYEAIEMREKIGSYRDREHHTWKADKLYEGKTAKEWHDIHTMMIARNNARIVKNE